MKTVEEHTDTKEFKRIIKKYKVLAEIETNGISETGKRDMVFWGVFCKYAWQKLAVLFAVGGPVIVNGGMLAGIWAGKEEYGEKGWVEVGLAVVQVGAMLTVQITHPGYLPKRTLSDSSTLLSSLPPSSYSSFCFSCLSAQPLHTHHCPHCNRCTPSFHLHSLYFSTCIGLSNARSYFLFLTSTLLLLTCYLVCLYSMADVYTSNRLLQYVEMHVYGWNQCMWVPMLICELGWVMVLDSVLEMWVAVTRQMTVEEIRKPWDYKALLEVRKVDEKYAYRQKSVSLWRCIVNMGKFLLGIRLVETKKEKNGKSEPKRKGDDEYIELAVIDRGNRTDSDRVESINEGEETADELSSSR